MPMKPINRWEALRPDLIFLDIQMPEKTGFDLLEMLDNVPEVIFVTAYHEYAVQAFEVNALDYILKPFAKSALARRWIRCAISSRVLRHATARSL